MIRILQTIATHDVEKVLTEHLLARLRPANPGCRLQFEAFKKYLKNRREKLATSASYIQIDFIPVIYTN